jgi:hypothetical protein
MATQLRQPEQDKIVIAMTEIPLILVAQIETVQTETLDIHVQQTLIADQVTCLLLVAHTTVRIVLAIVAVVEDTQVAELVEAEVEVAPLTQEVVEGNDG